MSKLYLVFENDSGEEFVIRGGPKNNNPLNHEEIIIEANDPLENSSDARGTDTPADRGNRELDLGGRLAEDVWEIMKQQATNIHDAMIDYKPLLSAQNSNSTIASVLNSIGLAIASNVPTNTQITDLPGIGNLLNFNTTLDGTTADDIIWGYDGIDNLFGNNGEDTLKGGEGNDHLDGGKDDDVLIGGNGLDTYVVDGNDRIIDSDGQGVVLDKNGNSIIGAFIQQADGTYVFQADNSISATKNSPLTLHLPDGSTAVIENHASNGDFGIFLVDENAPASPLYDLTIVGDLQPEDPAEFDDLGNIVVGTEEALDREDTLFGSVGNDLIRSLGGDDDVDAKAGEDRIEGGSGEDDLKGGADNDVVVGGEDSDILSGGEGNDWLYAETEFTIADAYSLGKTQIASGGRGDLLGGGSGDDTLIGEAGEDILLGGMGKDIIMGLGGDDNIEGDDSLVFADRNWDVTNTLNTEGDVTDYIRSYNFNLTLTDVGDAD